MEDRALILLQHPEWGERGTVSLLQGKGARQALLRVCSWERDLFPYYRMRIEDWALSYSPHSWGGGTVEMLDRALLIISAVVGLSGEWREVIYLFSWCLPGVGQVL